MIEVISRHFCHGGDLGYFKHRSETNDCDMRFAVYTPPQVSNGPVPVVYYLAGLTCQPSRSGFDDPPLALPRLEVRGDATFADFVALLESA